MDKFLQLNKEKLRFAYLASSVTFLALAIIPLIIGYFTEQIPSNRLLISILLISVIVFPIFIIFIAYAEWKSKTKVRMRMFSKQPYSRLEEIGFSKSFFNKHTKWFFTEETKEGIINGFKVLCDITRKNPNVIEFKTLVELQEFTINEFQELKIKMKKQDIEFDFGGLTKRHDIRTSHIHTIRQLKADLERFTDTIIIENFKPK